MQQLLGHSDRTLLPRGLLGRRVALYAATFRFEIGDAVTFHGDSAVVRDRSRSAAGRELYTIEMAADDKRPVRTVLGGFLDEGDPQTRNSCSPLCETEREMLLLPATNVLRHELARQAAA